MKYGSNGSLSGEIFVAARPSWAEIDLAALENNYEELRRYLDPHTKVFASIKADAYGHGALPVARALLSHGVHGFMTASLADARKLRRAGIEAPIVMFSSQLPEANAALLRERVIPTVFTIEAAVGVSEIAIEPTPVFVKVDCGLGRVGVPIGEAEAYIRKIAALPRLLVEGIYTHLPFADHVGRDWAAERLRFFHTLILSLERAGIVVPIRQALSSSGVLAGLTHDGCNAVCVGHSLYGLKTVAKGVASFEGFRQVFSAVKARVIHIASHPEARSAGLGGYRTYKAGSVTGIVPIGIGDGYRPSSSEASVLIRGQRAPVMGVGLAHTTIDLSEMTSRPVVGEKVVIMGNDGADCITVDEMAKWHDASVLDIVTAFSGRLPFLYIHGSVEESMKSGQDYSSRKRGHY